MILKRKFYIERRSYNGIFARKTSLRWFMVKKEKIKKLLNLNFIDLTNGTHKTANVVVVVQNDNGKITWRTITLYPDKKD